MDILTLTLNPCVDRTLWVEDFDAGPNRIDEQSGGKGVNIARVLAAFGVDVCALAPCGGQAGARFAALAREEGVPLETVSIEGETRTIITQARVSDCAQKVDRGAPPEMSDAECAALYERVAARMKQARCLVIGGSACCEGAARVAAELIAFAKSLGVRVFLDSNGLALAYGARALPDVIKPNQSELSELIGRPVEPGGEEAAARELISRGIEAVLVSIGERGALKRST